MIVYTVISSEVDRDGGIDAPGTDYMGQSLERAREVYKEVIARPGSIIASLEEHDFNLKAGRTDGVWDVHEEASYEHVEEGDFY